MQTKVRLFDNWQFCLGETTTVNPEELSGMKFRPVQLPHDWSTDYPFDENADTCGSGAYVVAGIGLYTRNFYVDALEGRNLFLYFEGVYMNSKVFINGKLAGGHVYGYTPFALEITDLVKEEAENQLLVVVDNSLQPGSRWYSGSGITRDVWLEYREKISLARYGTYVTTSIEESGKAAVQVETTMLAESIPAEKDQVTVTLSLKDVEGIVVVEAKKTASDTWEQLGQMELVIDAREKAEKELWKNQLSFTLPVDSPKLWTPEVPYGYSLCVTVSVGTETVDETTLFVGIRRAVFDCDKGFLLNDKQVKMNGVCLHHDGGCVGAAVPVKIWERRLYKMKEMGVNALRFSHNPPDEALLDLCDRMGFLVMDEAFDEWEIMKAKELGSNTHESHGYSAWFKQCHELDMRLMLYRDRNHPSIVIWSIGNEVPEQTVKDGHLLARHLKEICREVDPTRPITQANDNIVAEPRPATDEFLEELDVVGYNYVGRWRTRAESFYDEDRHKYPHRCVIGSENPSAGIVRGDYSTEVHRESFWKKPYFTAPVLVGKLLRYTMTHDFVAGDFMWTGIDYLGEAHWPGRSAACGCLDTCGFEKDAFYFYKSIWNQSEPFVYACPHWNLDGKEGTVLPMLVYTNCEEAELFVNGVSYGRKAKGFPCYGMTEYYSHFDKYKPPMNTDDLFLSWDVPYHPGKVEVVGYTDGEEISRYTMVTAGEAVRIEATVESVDGKEASSVLKADGRDIAQIKIRILDEKGNFVPNANIPLQIRLEGNGTILGLDNGNPECHEPWKSDKRSSFNGMAYAVVQAGKIPGKMRLTIEGPELEKAEVLLSAE